MRVRIEKTEPEAPKRAYRWDDVEEGVLYLDAVEDLMVRIGDHAVWLTQSGMALNKGATHAAWPLTVATGHQYIIEE